MIKINGKATSGGQARRLEYTGAIFICSLPPQLQDRTILPRHLGSMSPRFFNSLVALSRPPPFSSRHRGMIRTMLEVWPSVFMLVEA